ncbi:LysR family transcriptional regulator [Sphingomonas sp.]|uniref:LysR family transcriptional regulator n=1 Tax=Sphingomonas sp. TaxID=28214 RepID=UPI0033429494
MDWSDLPFFLEVARSQQIGRASVLLGVDATTVGRRLRRLEQAVGQRLFEQSPSGQILTVAGLDLLERATAMEEIAAGARITSDSKPEIAGTVRVSVAEGFGTWFVSRHLGRLADAYPRLNVDLVASSGFLNPTRRETDVAVLLARPRRGPLRTRKLTDYALRLYASADYLTAKGAVASLHDLRSRRMIGYVPDIIYAPELRYLDEIPGARQPSLRSSSINAQARMIASGAGIGILPCFIGDADPKLVAILAEIRITRSFWLVTHQDTSLFPAIRAFSDWLTALVVTERQVLMPSSKSCA